LRTQRLIEAANLRIVRIAAHLVSEQALRELLLPCMTPPLLSGEGAGGPACQSLGVGR
jgi:hypothetical protein